MTEEASGQQSALQGEVATAVKQDVSASATETKTETAPNTPDKEKITDESTKKENKDWAIDIITGLRHNIRETKAQLEAKDAEIAALKAGLAPKQGENLTEAEINRRADELANQRRFNEQCNKIAEDGKKDFPTFDGAIANLRAVGALGDNSNPAFLQAVTELPEAHKLLHHLGNNPDEAARINALPPMKMAIELARIESEITTPKPKPISKAPAPIVPVSGSGGSSNDLSDVAMSMSDWSKIRQKQREERANR